MGLSTTAAVPAVAAVDISDLALSDVGADLFELDGVALEPAPLRARRVIVRLDSLTVVYHRTNVRLRTRSRPQAGLAAYVTFGPKAVGTAEGVALDPGTLVVVAPESESGFVVEPGYESLALLVSPAQLDAHCAGRAQRPRSLSPGRLELLRSVPSQAQRLFALGKRLVDAAARRPDAFDDGRAARAAAESDLLEALLSALLAADPDAHPATERTRRTHSRIVKLAEHYVLARPGERVHVSELCAAAEVSERTLEGAFHEVVGMSPTAYLTRLRLQRVRTALLAAPPGSTRVSDEALAWGFWHFGEFSRAYQRCFGELPSRTLRHARRLAN